jgi:hypothetical protein
MMSWRRQEMLRDIGSRRTLTMMESIASALFTRSRAERAMVNIGVMMMVVWLGTGVLELESVGQ